MRTNESNSHMYICEFIVLFKLGLALIPSLQAEGSFENLAGELYP